MPSGREPLYFVLVQITDGTSLPYTALVEARVADGAIEFSVPEDWGFTERSFTGRFAGGQLVVATPAGHTEHLERGHSYWEFSAGRPAQ